MAIACLRVLAVSAAVVASGSASSARQSPQFRTTVSLVPVEVHAVGRDGEPITDLTAADFAIREDGRLQQVALFDRGSDSASSPAKGRTFLIALGSGRLNQPARATEALIDRRSPAASRRSSSSFTSRCRRSIV